MSTHQCYLNCLIFMTMSLPISVLIQYIDETAQDTSLYCFTQRQRSVRCSGARKLESASVTKFSPKSLTCYRCIGTSNTEVFDFEAVKWIVTVGSRTPAYAT